MLNDLNAYLESSQKLIVDWQTAISAIPALGPINGGDGELARSEYLRELMASMGLEDIEAINAPDPAVSSGIRPNLTAKVRGRDNSKTFWLISHTDIVPPGDLSLWNSDPYKVLVDGDKIIGRGVEDNQQGIVSSLMLAKALKDLKISPPINLGILLVADEETGSAFGLEYLLKERPQFFSPNDLILVTDFGDPTSTTVEVAEKHMLWLKITVHGQQCHASTPSEGRNTLRAASDLIMRFESLRKTYSAVDPMFDPPVCTFEPTRKEANVPNINTVPGKDVFYLDCRILPGYDLDTVYMSICDVAKAVENDRQVKIDFEIIQRSSAPPTDERSEVVVRLCKGIEAVYGKPGRPVGIGGGTVAAALRRKGLSAAVWGTWLRTAHQPNETALITAHIGDAKVMAYVLTR